jgi:predicted membrane-bound dolichyl-phosphate-mannose-protein mannosyltransferase
MSKYQQDLIRIGSYTIKKIDRPYSLVNSWDISVQNIYNHMRQVGKQNNRIMTMVYGYYLGELIHFSVTPREKWKEFVHEHNIPNEYYLYRGAERIYRLFERDPEQIYRTLTLTFKILSRMTISEYKSLLQYNSDLHDFTNTVSLNLS